eukprot:1160442-Pelagomonas_calceolata.AAC.14
MLLWLSLLAAHKARRSARRSKRRTWGALCHKRVADDVLNVAAAHRSLHTRQKGVWRREACVRCDAS